MPRKYFKNPCFPQLNYYAPITVERIIRSKNTAPHHTVLKVSQGILAAFLGAVLKMVRAGQSIVLHVQTETAVKLHCNTDTAETQQILNAKAGDRAERIKSHWGRNLDRSLETLSSGRTGRGTGVNVSKTA